jgi:hypothetical protein
MNSNYYEKYLKYKNKYNNLKKMIGGDDIVIDIDDYRFKLIGKYISNPLDDNEKDKVLIHSSKLDGSDLVSFLVYLSTSDIGCWRFLVFDQGKYYKGTDYITGTFIEIRLQKFIFDNYHLIPNANLASPEIGIMSNNIKEISNFYKNNNINLLPEFFEFMKEVIFVRNDNFLINKNTNLIIKDLLSQTKFAESKKLATLKNIARCGEYTHNYRLLFEQNKDIRDILISHIPDFMRKYADHKRFPPHLEVFKKYFDNDHDEFKALHDIIDSYLKQINMNVNQETLTFQYAFKKKFDSAEVTMNVYTIEATIDEDEYILYCGNYNFTFSGSTNNFNCIINLLPKSSKITNIGLHSQPLSIGLYICKIIDYEFQLKIKPDRLPFVSTTYKFIGHYMHNIHPLETIVFPRVCEPVLPQNTALIYTPVQKYLDGKINIYNLDIYDLSPKVELLEILEPLKEKINELNLCFYLCNRSDIPVEEFKKRLRILFSEIPEEKKELFKNFYYLDFIINIHHLSDGHNCKFDKNLLNKIIYETITDDKLSKYLDPSGFSSWALLGTPSPRAGPAEEDFEGYVPKTNPVPRDYDPKQYNIANIYMFDMGSPVASSPLLRGFTFNPFVPAEIAPANILLLQPPPAWGSVPVEPLLSSNLELLSILPRANISSANISGSLVMSPNPFPRSNLIISVPLLRRQDSD